MKRCLFRQSGKFYALLTLLGLALIAAGAIWMHNMPEQSDNLDMFAGMIAGMGGSFACIGAYAMVRRRRATPETLRRERVEQTDERNVEIRHKAYAVSNMVGTLLFALLAFVFVWLDYRTPAFLCIAAMCVQTASMFIAIRVIGRRM